MSLKHFLKLLKPDIKIRCYLQKTRSLFTSLGDSPNAELDKTSYDKYMCLPTPECKVQAEYIWIDGTGEHVRSKVRTLDSVPDCVKNIPLWSYDGSSTMQSHVENSECTLIPVAMYNDPIRRGNHKLILCETFDFNEKPAKTNHRNECVKALDKACDEEIWVGFEQEYILLGMDGRPFGWPRNGDPPPPGFYYCGVGANKAMGRIISECHYRACLYCGIDLHGTNAEVMLSQWEFQVGTSAGLKACDDLWMARFLLLKIAEEFGVGVTFHPKLYPHWSGSGIHTNISSKKMRDEGGIKYVEEAMKKLEKTHKEDLLAFDPRGGKDNKRRLVGLYEASSRDKFTWGVANRASSVRIPKSTALKKKGFFEDRRPAGNADPYRILATIVNSCFVNKC